jgi:Zn ribbon nucleic-acid-binding protein
MDDLTKAVFRSRDLAAVTCGACGHADTLESFCNTEIAGPTGRDVFQCPKCRRAFKRRQFVDKWQMPRCELVECQARL